MRTGLIIAATITALTASTAIAQTFETVDRSPPATASRNRSISIFSVFTPAIR
ncbi:hypothetical protein HED49_24175 [Ochrobactrum daejeonense]|nr:hypothetical protein [Brucella daejeonensis]NKB80280.1 hypothetical protein [Brucella daejeonensis]